MELAPALALDGSSASTGKGLPLTSFTSGQEALRLGEEDLRAGKMEASVAPLTYAAESGQVIARWKLGQMYAKGDGVPRDDLKRTITSTRSSKATTKTSLTGRTRAQFRTLSLLSASIV